MAETDDFERLTLPHLDAVYRAALALTGREEDARELVQTTYLKALRRFESFRPGTNCKAWLLAIMRHTRIDQLRHDQVVGRQVSIEEQRLAAPEQPEETAWSNPVDLLENFADEQIIRALGELPEQHRLTLYLVDVEQLSQEEVAEITGVAVGTVKSRTSRARALLRQRLLSHARDLGLVDRKS